MAEIHTITPYVCPHCGHRGIVQGDAERTRCIACLGEVVLKSIAESIVDEAIRMARLRAAAVREEV